MADREKMMMSETASQRGAWDAREAGVWAVFRRDEEDKDADLARVRRFVDSVQTQSKVKR